MEILKKKKGINFMQIKTIVHRDSNNKVLLMYHGFVTKTYGNSGWFDFWCRANDKNIYFKCKDDYWIIL